MSSFYKVLLRFARNLSTLGYRYTKIEHSKFEEYTVAAHLAIVLCMLQYFQSGLTWLGSPFNRQLKDKHQTSVETSFKTQESFFIHSY
jgi:hypothetical protein